MIRILLVDDEPLNLNLSKEFLEKQEEDFKITTASSAQEALRLLSEEEYDVVVSDYQMAEMTGIEFLGELRHQGNDTPFIIFTGKGREEVAVEAFERGAQGYVMKGGHPASQYAVLASNIRQTFNRKKAEEERAYALKALLDSEEKYRTLVELAHDGILITEGSGRTITFINKRMADMLGYKVDELLGTSYVDLVHPDQRREYLSTKDSHRHGSGETLERHLIRKDGSRLYTLLSVSSLDPGNGSPSAPSLCIFTDISDRKKAEEQLQESEGRHRTIVENIHEALIIIGEDRLIEYANPQAERLSGFKLGEIVGKRFDEFLTPESLKTVAERYARRREGKAVPPNYDIEIVSKNGAVVNVELAASVFAGEDGTPKTIAALKDLSERRKSEEALRRSDERYRLAVENLQDLLVIVDEDHRIKFVNQRIERYGYIPDEVIGKKFDEFIVPQSLKKVTERYFETASEGDASSSPVFEAEILTRDGSLRHMEISTSIFPTEDGKKETLAILKDITKRRRLENAVRQSERRLLYILENLGVGLTISDGNGILTYANPAFAKMVGYRPEELIGRKGRSIVHEDDLTLRDADYARRKKGISSTTELNLVSKDARAIPVMKIATPIFEENGHFDGSYSITVDLTERKRREERDRFLHSLLRHDLVNKLQGASICLELLRRTDLSDKQGEYVNSLKETCLSLNNLAEKIRELEEIDESEEPVNIDLDLVIRNALEEYSETATRKEIAIDYKGIPSAIVEASPLLKSVFTNLIDDSIEHADCKNIKITVNRLKRFYRVTIKDDGKGLPKTVKKRIFERGIRGAGSSGSGIGLYLVKRIIDTSNGRILLKDSKKGTRFDIHLKKPG